MLLIPNLKVMRYLFFFFIFEERGKGGEGRGERTGEGRKERRGEVRGERRERRGEKER